MLSPGRRRAAAVVALAAMLATVVAGAALSLLGGDETQDAPADGVTITWGGGEGAPSCLYDPESETVFVTLVVQGTAPEPESLAVTVTAYADENTSDPVGSITDEVPVEGTVRAPFILTIDVDRPPHVDEDGVAACRLSVED